MFDNLGDNSSVFYVSMIFVADGCGDIFGNRGSIERLLQSPRNLKRLTDIMGATTLQTNLPELDKSKLAGQTVVVGKTHTNNEKLQFVSNASLNAAEKDKGAWYECSFAAACPDFQSSAGIPRCSRCNKISTV